MAANVLVDSETTVHNTGTTHTGNKPTFPRALQNGDLLVFHVITRTSDTGAWTPPTDFVEIPFASVLNVAESRVFLKYVTDAGSEPSTYSATSPSSRSSTVTMVIVEGAGSSPQDGNSSGTFSSMPQVVPGHSTTANDELVLVFGASGNPGATYSTSTSGWTVEYVVGTGTGTTGRNGGMMWGTQAVAGLITGPSVTYATTSHVAEMASIKNGDVTPPTAAVILSITGSVA